MPSIAQRAKKLNGVSTSQQAKKAYHTKPVARDEGTKKSNPYRDEERLSL